MTVLTSRGKTTSVASRSRRTTRSDAAALGLLATRVSFAARRCLQGISLTEDDRSVLREVARQIREEAAAARALASPTVKGTNVSRGASAGLAIGALASDDKNLDDDQLASLLSKLAKDLSSLAKGDSTQASSILKVFETIGSLARAEAGSVGERLIGRD